MWSTLEIKYFIGYRAGVYKLDYMLEDFRRVLQEKNHCGRIYKELSSPNLWWDIPFFLKEVNTYLRRNKEMVKELKKPIDDLAIELISKKLNKKELALLVNSIR